MQRTLKHFISGARLFSHARDGRRLLGTTVSGNDISVQSISRPYTTARSELQFSTVHCVQYCTSPTADIDVFVLATTCRPRRAL